ncbi:MAG: hypothetical protein JWM98_1859 [Thermoleophilia bacterium]|nr:hypothetical protein [Thermoleophilia bacterium]
MACSVADSSIGVKFRVARAESPLVDTSPDLDAPPAQDAPDDRAHLEVVGGVVRVARGPGAGPAELSWAAGDVRVTLFGEPVEGTTCRVLPTAPLRVEPVRTEPRNRYVVQVSRDRMEATLRVVPEPGTARTIVEADAAPRLRLTVVEERLEPADPDLAAAMAELQRAGVVHGIDQAAVRAAIVPGAAEAVVAVGTEPFEGRNGYLEPLVDFAAMRTVGVLADTPLLRRVRKRDGIAGRDVTGRELTVPVARDVRIRPGSGVSVDDQGIMAVATVDGSPHMDSEGSVEVRHELVLEVVDAVSGDIAFNGSVRVEGDVGEARRVVARDQLVVEGNVDRARLESGGSMRVDGSIMSSVLRAGGERAVAATIADRVLELPRTLGTVSAQARQLRDVVTAAGKDMSHALSVQLVLEGKQRGVLPDLLSVAQDLREAGPAHTEAADRAARWHRMLATAANIALTPDQFVAILTEIGALAADVKRAIEEPADLVVSYMQASEAEATGEVTLVGKGIFNSRIVAWNGLVARQYDAVLRGGSILSHGRVHVREVGSPAGAKTHVQLGKGASLEADHAHAGTVVSGPGYTHRFVADRANVKVDFDSGGSMNVESLAA